MSTPPRPPRYRLILLPVKSITESRDAAIHTAILATALEASVAILGMMDTGGELAFTPAAAVAYARLRAETQEAIEAASAIVRASTIPLVEHLIMDGVPTTMILETAAELGASLIVLSGEYTTANSLPTTVAAVLRDAPCPVLIVPLSAAAQTA